MVEPAGIVVLRPGDDLPLHAARASVTAAIHNASADGTRGLVLDFQHWSGRENPSLAARIDSVFEWAAAAAATPGLVVALVMPPQMVDPGKIGFVIARRLGFTFDVFGSVDEATAWVASELPG